MKRKIIISSIALLSIATFYVFFFSKSTLLIKMDYEARIEIGGKTYESDNLVLRLRPGNYKLAVKKDFYKDYSEEIRLGYLTKREVRPQLELTPEAKERREKSKKVAEEFIKKYTNYSYENVVNYIDTVQPYVTDSLFKELKKGHISNYMLENYRKTQYSVSSEIKKMEISKEEGGKIYWKIEVLRKTKSSEKNEEKIVTYELEITKEDNQWKISDISYK